MASLFTRLSTIADPLPPANGGGTGQLFRWRSQVGSTWATICRLALSRLAAWLPRCLLVPFNVFALFFTRLVQMIEDLARSVKCP